MGKNTSISIGEHFEGFIKSQTANGRYHSASEVVRAALRLLEAEEEKLKNLRMALKAGEASGFVKDFNPQAFKARLEKEAQS